MEGGRRFGMGGGREARGEGRVEVEREGVSE